MSLARKCCTSLGAFLQSGETSSNKFDLMVVLMTEDARVTAVLRLFQPDTLDGGVGENVPRKCHEYLGRQEIGYAD